VICQLLVPKLNVVWTNLYSTFAGYNTLIYQEKDILSHFHFMNVPILNVVWMNLYSTLHKSTFLIYHGKIISSLLSIVRTNSSTSVRRGDDVEYISVWTTPSSRLIFWDDAPSLISGIRAMPQTLDRMCEISHEWIGPRSLPCGTPPVGWLAGFLLC